MKQFLLIIACLPLIALLNACGKSDNNGSTAVPASQAGGAVVVSSGNSYSYTQSIQGSYPYFYVNYQFKENGCDTDMHRFSGPSDGVVRSQLCAGLQNGWMNHNCAADLRQAYYAQMCL